MKSTYRGWLIAILLLAALPNPLQAQFDYTTNDGQVTITSYTGGGGDVIIPKAINGLPVTRIGERAFLDRTNLASITIPNSVTRIGEQAFSGCTRLTSVTFPNQLREIERWTFYDCTSLSTVTIPGSVSRIWGWAFAGCTSLTNINIPNSVTSISNGAFAHCTSLTSITIPNSVTEIGGSAFSFCVSLISVSLPHSITSIDDELFWSCSSLASVTIPNNVTRIGALAFRDCTSLASITIPSKVTRIGEQAFSGCAKLGSLTIPNKVTNIEMYTFYGCASLTAVAIPNGVTTIGDWSFSACTELISISIPNSVTSISEYAFYGCTSLTSVTIPDSVSSIGQMAFRNCANLTAIHFGGNAPLLGADVFAGDELTIVYYFLNTAGWGSTFGGRPTAPAAMVPSIEGQAKLAILREDREARLTVRVWGYPEPQVQWFLNSTAVPEGTNVMLILPAVSRALEGTYWLVASNALGRATSAPIVAVVSNVDPQPLATLRWTGSLANALKLEATDALTPGAQWRSLSNYPPANAEQQWVEPATEAARLYRLNGSGPALGQISVALLRGWLYAGPIGSRHRIEYISRDLGWTNWQTLTVLTLPVSPYWFVDVESVSQPTRVYRTTPVQ